MILRSKKDNNGYYLTCLGKPECNHVIWLADVIRDIKIAADQCRQCQAGTKNLTIKFKSSNLLGLLIFNRIDDNGEYTSCILCDTNLRNVLDINEGSFQRQDQTRTNTSTNSNQFNNFTRPANPPVSRDPIPNPNQNRPNNFGSHNTTGGNSNRGNNSNGNHSSGNNVNVNCPHCNQPATK